MAQIMQRLCKAQATVRFCSVLLSMHLSEHRTPVLLLEQQPQACRRDRALAHGIPRCCAVRLPHAILLCAVQRRAVQPVRQGLRGLQGCGAGHRGAFTAECM